MGVLYQKYRPQGFSEVLGQNNIKTILQNEIVHEKVAHSYLFCGPRAVGKTTLARILAKAINCQKRKKEDFEPCNDCPSCQSINNFSNLDVIEIDAASNTGVDNVRENIIALSRVVSTNNKYKVFIIDEVHMLSVSAFNALLKTLEEPPRGVVFILCTTEAYKVPLTIISRCQRFDFKKIGVPDMVLKLETIVKKEKIEVEKDVLELVASKAGGHLRDAESLLGQIMVISGKKIDLNSASLLIPYNNIEENINFLNYLAFKDVSGAIELLNNIIFNGINLKLFVTDLIELLRKMILLKVSPAVSSLGVDFSEKVEIKINELNQKISQSDLIFLSELFLNRLGEIDNHFIPQMPIELAVIEFCGQEGERQVKNKDSNNFQSTITDDKKNIPDQEEVHKNKKETEGQESKGSLSVNEITDKWPEFLLKLKPHNHSLSFVMQSCKIDSLTNNKICLSFKYKFHKDRLDKPEIKDIIVKTLKEVYKSDLSVEALVDKDLVINTTSEFNKKANKTIDDILKTFGGQVIN